MRASRSSAFIIALLGALTLIAQPPPGYYDAAEGLTGDTLKQVLHTIISNQTVHLYQQLWADFRKLDRRPDSTVWDIYSDVPGGTPPYVYQFVADQCGTYNSEGDCFNREHSVPQSWFAGNEPMYTDLHHIYPVDGWVNNKRGELPYGLVGSADWTSQNGSKVGLCIAPGYNGTVFEPIDAYKGDLARTYFYMMTRYLGSVSAWTSDMFANGDLAQWAEDMLVQWNDNDPVSAKEIARNDSICLRQGNRNPYIDRPEWVHSVWGATAGVEEHARMDARAWWDQEGLHITSARAMNATINVFDLSGRTVMTTNINGTRRDAMFDACSGIYVVMIGSSVDRSALRVAR